MLWMVDKMSKVNTMPAFVFPADMGEINDKLDRPSIDKIAGQTPEEKEYFEVNARTLLTTWGFKGHALRDYARRTWHGLVAHFYKHRWEIFINHSLNAARKGIDVDPENMKDDIYQFEWNFTQKLADADLTEAPVNGTPVEVMRRMVIKYSPLIQQQADQNASNEGQEKRVKVTPHDFY